MFVVSARPARNHAHTCDAARTVTSHVRMVMKLWFGFIVGSVVTFVYLFRHLYFTHLYFYFTISLLLTTL